MNIDFSKCIKWFEKNLDFSFSNINIINDLSCEDAPICCRETNCIVLCAHSQYQCDFQLAHELTHMYLPDFGPKYNWFQELLACTMAYSYLYSQSDADGYLDYLNQVILQRQPLSLDELKRFINANLSSFQQDPYLVYHDTPLACKSDLFFALGENYDFFKILKSAKVNSIFLPKNSVSI